MRKDFYIFRHGETDYNKEKRWQGCGIDTELNENGLRQAKELAEALAPKRLQIIYSSCLKRAVETAKIVAELSDIEVKKIEDLREGCFGKAEGMRKVEVAEKYPEIFELWYDDETDYMDVAFPEGETKREMQMRMFAVFEKLLETKENVIGVASHGSSIRYFLMKFGFSLGRMPNTALFHLVYENGNWFVECE